MISRRQLLAGGAASLLAAPAIVRAQSQWRAFPFSLGVASGDPAPDGFVIWTRLAPEPLEPGGGMGMGPVPVSWEVASDEGFLTVVARGEAVARPELAHAVHVEVTGLQPDRPYFYRFEQGGERSLRGRARTLPAAGASPERLRFGVAGCQSYEDGFYTAYRHLAGEEDLAFVYHYGDYIYEYRGDPLRPRGGDVFEPVRTHLGQLLFSTDDYRRRYAQYKLDPDLQRAHAAHAFFMSFDDHEADNNWVSDIDDGVPPELFRLRRQAAFQAWYEHMPLRRRSLPNGSAIQAYRSARYGNLAELNFLDTRQYRTNQPCDDGFKPVCPAVRSEQAAVLGAEQEAWLSRNLRSSARWNVLAQQVMMMAPDRRRAPDEAPEPILNMDTWAAYQVPRQRLLARLAGLGNAVVLTGDEHQNWAGIVHDARDRPVAAEFVATSISSGGDGEDLRPGNAHILASNPQLKFLNSQRGYHVHEVGRDAWTTHVMVMDQVRERGGTLSRRAAITVPHGRAEMTVT